MLDDLKKEVKEIGKFKDKYLVSCFLMKGQWRIDYYSPKEHLLYTYSKRDGKYCVDKDEIFQKEKKKLEKLSLEDVKIHYEEALEKVKYPGEHFIIILQVIDKKPVWNITILTTEFKMYNVKVDAVNGKVTGEEEANLLDFKKGGDISS
jgi:hypothetical protein